MCGIAGFVDPKLRGSDDDGTLRAMCDTMANRGPDDAGLASRHYGTVRLGHRRLAIMDLSSLGHQPMSTDDDQLTIVFNGEIYNHLELRTDLAEHGIRFRSLSDTETILAVYRVHGTRGFARLRGMFAFAIWDAAASEMVLARDTHGIKPLYYRQAPSFAFASQVTALLADPETERRIDPEGLASYAIWGSVSEPHTIVAGIRALPAGHVMRVTQAGDVASIEPFRTLEAAFQDASASCATDPRATLRDSVRAHMLADTEVGCFLSAGVDSGAILGMMRDCNPARLRAITLRFSEFAGTERDESPLAAQVAALYDADHHVETIDAQDFNTSLPQILQAMDQPSIDGVNSWFVSRAASRIGLKVAMSGLGGDELLGGYSTFRTVPNTLRLTLAIRRLGPLAGVARAVLTRYGTGKARHALEYGHTMAGAYLLRRSMALPEQAPDILPARLVGSYPDAYDPRSGIARHAGNEDQPSVSRVGLLEASLYMRNQLLRDSDWAGMAHSLEIRLPLVDATVTEHMAGHLPAIAGARGKTILASAMATPLPASIVQRRKTGFGIPVAQWLGGNSDTRLSANWAGTVLEAYIERHRLTV